MLLGCSLCSTIEASDGRIVTTYYGNKATGDASNPCKGRTTRKCAVVETTDYEMSDGATMIASVLKDAEGKVILTDYEIVKAALDEVVEKQVFEFSKKPFADVQVFKE